jgi:hypothetical protein
LNKRRISVGNFDLSFRAPGAIGAADKRRSELVRGPIASLMPVIKFYVFNDKVDERPQLWCDVFSGRP